MQLTLHVTKACNLRCRYCYYRDFPGGTMSPDTALQAVDRALDLGHNHLGVTFFGGEPLLAKDLIRDLVPEIQARCGRRGVSVNFKIPTNGLLLDRAFVEFCEANAVFLSLSLDGDPSANADRVTLAGRDAYAGAETALELLVRHTRAFATYSVVTPANAAGLSRSLKHLHQRGSRILISALDYGANWTRRDLDALRGQYEDLAGFYETETRAARHFYLSIFDSRIRGRTRPDPASDCRIGISQLSVTPDGRFYPCIQFVEHPEFAIGDATRGIDSSLRQRLFAQSLTGAPECRSCGINDRCSRNCACVSWQTTGTLDGIAPIVCEHERLLTPIADALARRLYRSRVPLFINKHYNPRYDMLRAVEDIIIHHRHETPADSLP